MSGPGERFAVRLEAARERLDAIRSDDQSIRAAGVLPDVLASLEALGETVEEHGAELGKIGQRISYQHERETNLRRDIMDELTSPRYSAIRDRHDEARFGALDVRVDEAKSVLAYHGALLDRHEEERRSDLVRYGDIHKSMLSALGLQRDSIDGAHEKIEATRREFNGRLDGLHERADEIELRADLRSKETDERIVNLERTVEALLARLDAKDSHERREGNAYRGLQLAGRVRLMEARLTALEDGGAK